MLWVFETQLEVSVLFFRVLGITGPIFDNNMRGVAHGVWLYILSQGWGWFERGSVNLRNDKVILYIYISIYGPVL